MGSLQDESIPTFNNDESYSYSKNKTEARSSNDNENIAKQ